MTGVQTCALPISAGSGYEDAETGTEEQQTDCQRRCKLGLMEGGDERDGGSGCRKQEPGTAAHPEVSQRAPEKIDSVRKRKQRRNARGARGVYALVAQQIGDGAAHEAERDDRLGRDEEGEKPGAIVRRRRGLGLDFRPRRC